MRLCPKFTLAITLILAACAPPFARPPSPIEAAQEKLDMGDYEGAVAIYSSHMEERLKESDRPEWENPYFYSLLIGDIYLKHNKPDKALAAYNSATTHQVDKALVTDRYLTLAKYYEDRGKLQEAYDLLAAKKELDPLTIETRMDKIVKELTRREEENQPITDE